MPNHLYKDTMAIEDHDIMSTKPDQHMGDDQAPVLPQKSALRASRLLDDLMKGLKVVPAGPPAFTQTPHDEYLSSEEEASSTAGDFSDFEYDSSSDDVSPSPIKACSIHETEARVVSVVFSGKPSVVDVPQARRSVSPVRRSLSPDSTKQTRSVADPTEKLAELPDFKLRRASTSTATSDSKSPPPRRIVHPPRSSSMQPLGQGKDKPFFLRIDPYANGSTYTLPSAAQEDDARPPSRPAEDERPKTPKSPGKMFKGVARAMSLMKRKSIPKMNQAYLAPSSEHSPLPSSPSNGSIPEEAEEETPTELEEQSSIPRLPSRPASQQQFSPVTTDDLLPGRSLSRNDLVDRHLSVSRTFHYGETVESPISPLSPMSATSSSSSTVPTNGKRMSSFNLARRRMSVKLTGVKF